MSTTRLVIGWAIYAIGVVLIVPGWLVITAGSFIVGEKQWLVR